MDIQHGLCRKLPTLLAGCMLASSLYAQDAQMDPVTENALPTVLVHSVTAIPAESVNATAAPSQRSALIPLEINATSLANIGTWNFNDGSWQGWELKGQYTRGKIYVPRFRRYEGTFISFNPSGAVANFTTPVEQGRYGWSGPIMQRNVFLTQGEVYVLGVDYGTPEGFNPAEHGDQGVKVNDRFIIPHLIQGRNMATFNAYQTGWVTLTFWSRTPSGFADGDFTLDNITLDRIVPEKPIDPPVDPIDPPEEPFVPAGSPRS